jgi:membrane protein implicated in regulation of membrane protease activity
MDQYEQRLIHVLGMVIIAALPFLAGAFRDMIGIGLAATAACVMLAKLGGLWLGALACVASLILVWRMGAGPDQPARTGDREHTSRWSKGN